MKRKTKALVDRMVATISPWPSIACISLNEAAIPDTLDSYFALILDVYHDGAIPAADERLRLYGDDAAVFETSAQNNKDRFMIGELPVRIEYKSIQQVEELVSLADTRTDQLWLIKDSGTYGFYRLAHGELLYRRNDWIDGIRARLLNLGTAFWTNMRDAHQSKMEHFLSDLGAALIQGDDFHYLISAAGFIKNACEVLFCVNHRFEPSHRGFYEQVQQLPILPEDFIGRFESFLRSDNEMTAERKFSLAQLIARSVVVL